MIAHRLASSCCVLAFAVVSASAQLRQWSNPGTGSWFVDANWDSGQPADGESGFINNGGTARIVFESTNDLLWVYLGANSAAAGRLELIAGQLTALVVYSGDQGYGYLYQTGGSSITAASFGVGGDGPDGNGTFEMLGGTVDISGTMSIGHNATGLIVQNGGTITTEHVIHGNQPNGDGTWQMNGGTLNVSGYLFVGVLGAGNFTQSGSSTTVNVTTGVHIAWQTGSGTYALEGGTLTAGHIYRGSAKTGIFAMSGGRLVVDAFGSFVTNFDLSIGGGTLAPGDGSPGTTTVRGEYTQNGAATLEIDLDGTAPDSQYDVLEIFGGVTIVGELALDLGFTPSAGQTFLIVDNDDADPISGTFNGLPEGATVTATFGGDPSDFQISYVGGTGNDVVLTAECDLCGDCNCDGTFDGGDIDAFFLALGNPTLWQTTYPSCDILCVADINGDNSVDGGDIDAFFDALGFGACP